MKKEEKLMETIEEMATMAADTISDTECDCGRLSTKEYFPITIWKVVTIGSKEFQLKMDITIK